MKKCKLEKTLFIRKGKLEQAIRINFPNQKKALLEITKACVVRNNPCDRKVYIASELTLHRIAESKAFNCAESIKLKAFSGIRSATV